jgi:hypothetical protein
MPKFSLLSLLLLGFVWSGCDYFCPDGGMITPTFIGFSRSDIDSFVTRAYQPDGTFQVLLDTCLVVSNDVGTGNCVYTTSHDTTIAFINDGRPHSAIIYGCDWEIYIPAMKRTIFISHINGSTKKNGPITCLGPIHSFVQDGQTIQDPVSFQTSNFFTSGYRAYIHL